MNTSEVKKYSKGLVNSIKNGSLTLEEAVIESSTKTGCTKDYARKILNDYLKSGYSNNPDYVGDWFGKGQIDFNAIINPEDDGDVWMVKMWSGSGYILDVYLCKATNLYDAIDTVFEWSWENEGENNMVFDLDYVYDDARRVFEDDPNYFGSEYDWEDFSDRFIEEFYVANESYDLFCNAENFFVDKVPEDVLAENQKPVQNSRRPVKSEMSSRQYQNAIDKAARMIDEGERDVGAICKKTGLDEDDVQAMIDEQKELESVTSSRRVIKKKPIKSSTDNLPKEVYYMMVNGAKMYYSTDYDKVADMVQKINSKPGPRVYGPYTEDDPEEIQELYEVGYLSNSRKPVKSAKKAIKSGRFIKSGAGAGYYVTVRGIELDNRNWKILSDDYDERYDLHTVQVEIPVKPCVAEYWAAEAYYEGIDSSHDVYDSEMDRQIEGGTAILQLEVYPPQWIEGDIMTSEELDEAIGDLLPSELNLTTMYGGGWSHVDLPEEGIVFDDDNGRSNLDEGETYDYTTVRCELKCPNIIQNINAFFKNPEAYYDEDGMPQYPEEDDDEIVNSRKPVKSSITQRELKDMIRRGQAIDITYDENSLPEGVRLDILQISKGTYGMNGALFKGSDGNLYAIAGRTSNLFRWV